MDGNCVLKSAEQLNRAWDIYIDGNSPEGAFPLGGSRGFVAGVVLLLFSESRIISISNFAVYDVTPFVDGSLSARNQGGRTTDTVKNHNSILWLCKKHLWGMRYEGFHLSVGTFSNKPFKVNLRHIDHWMLGWTMKHYSIGWIVRDEARRSGGQLWLRWFHTLLSDGLVWSHATLASAYAVLRFLQPNHETGFIFLRWAAYY